MTEAQLQSLDLSSAAADRFNDAERARHLQPHYSSPDLTVSAIAKSAYADLMGRPIPTTKIEFQRAIMLAVLIGQLMESGQSGDQGINAATMVGALRHRSDQELKEGA